MISVDATDSSIKGDDVLALLLIFLFISGASISWLLGTRLVQSTNHQVPLPDGFVATKASIAGAGRSIAAWWTECQSHSPIVLLVHGFRADKSAMAARAALLARHGFSILMIDLQAHGETPGSDITLGWQESLDVEAAVAWLKAKFPERSMGAIGCSLGGASILLAKQPTGLDAIVLEAVYPRIWNAVENRVRLRAGGLAWLLAPMLLLQLPFRLRVLPNQLAPIRYIAAVGAPVLLIAGAEDRHTTLKESLALFSAAIEPKQLWIINGAQHDDFLATDKDEYEKRVVGFLNRHLKPVAATTPQEPCLKMY